MSLDRRRFLLTAAVSGAVAAIAGRADAVSAGKDDRVDDLIGRMTIEEKAGQLHIEACMSQHMADPDIAKQNPFLPPSTPAEAQAAFDAMIGRVKAGGVGALMTPMDLDSVSRAQQAAVTATRLKIPLLFGADIIHGCQTVFPVPLAEAASFEPELARRTARACAVEASARGLDLTFAPMVDIGRDQRWGRVVEGSGEDVLLGSLFAAARVAGFQGTKAAPDSLLACIKHFAAYGAPESGLDYQGNSLSDRVLHEVYLPPFRAAIEAGAILAMAAFNTLDGVPATGNHRLLTDILRGQLGFEGAVLSDYESEKELIAHGQAEDEADAARLALTAGCDMGMISGIFPRYVPGLVQSGAIPMATLDQAVRRILFVKREAGLFDNPFRRIDARRFAAPVPPAHKSLAREAATKSVVLLRNEGGLLPLRKQGQRIALIGPFGADSANLHGPWSPFAPQTRPVPLADGLRAAMTDPALLSVTAGSGITAPLPGGVEAAVAAAKAADVVLLAIGEGQDVTGESSSRAEIVVPAPQMALAEAVAATGKPVVVILRNGRALALDGAVRDARAILVGWFLGSETGPALAAILFGDAAPSGRLPVTFPLSTGQEPYHYARESSGRPSHGGATERFKSHFIGLPDAPLYPFGHGLTYGDIRYGAPVVTPGSGGFTATCEISNAGTRAAEEVVQLYIHDVASEVVQPVRKLVAFQKIRLAPSESRRVTFPIVPEQLSHLDRDCKIVPGEGAFDLWIAPSAGAGSPVRFRVG